MNRPTARAFSASSRRGPAAHAGLLSGDLIIALDGKAVTSVGSLLRALDAEKIDRTVSVDFLRRSDQLRVWIGPVERKAA